MLIDDIPAELTAPAVGDKLIARDISVASGDKVKYLLLSKLGVLSLAQSWTAKQSFAAGIDFGDETLSTYDTGTWTPVFADAQVAGAVGSASVVYGEYIKVGRLVNVSFRLSGISTAGMNVLNMAYLRGLPFVSTPNADYRGSGAAILSNVTFSGSISASINGNASALYLIESPSGGAVATVPVSRYASGTAIMQGALIYIAAA